MEKESIIEHILTINLILVKAQLGKTKCDSVNKIKSYLNTAIEDALKSLKLIKAHSK